MPTFKKNTSEFQMKGIDFGKGTESSFYKKYKSHLTKPPESDQPIPFAQEYLPGGKSKEDYDAEYKEFMSKGGPHISWGDWAWEPDEDYRTKDTDMSGYGITRFKGDREAFDAASAREKERENKYRELKALGYDMSDARNIDPSMLTQEERDAIDRQEHLDEWEKTKAKAEAKAAKEAEKEGEGDIEGEIEDEGYTEGKEKGSWRQRRDLRKDLRDQGYSRKEARQMAKEQVPRKFLGSGGKRNRLPGDEDQPGGRWKQRQQRKKYLMEQGMSRKDAARQARREIEKRKVSLGFLQKK